MAATCKHGVDVRFCAVCLEAAETEPLQPDALVVTADGNPALLLRPGSDSGNAPALVLENAVVHFANVALEGVLAPAGGFDRPGLLAQFHAVTQQMGYLFHPGRALTAREQTAVGPGRCYHCRVELSLAKRSLGCTKCQYYVCRCGRCLCGYTGKNYLGQLFSQFPALPIPRRDRLEYVRVVRFCTDGI